MATPFEFFVNELRRHIPLATAAPVRDSGQLPRFKAAHYFTPAAGAGTAQPDYARLHQVFPGGYPYYYPLQLTQPGQRPLRLCIATGADFLSVFTPPESALRPLLEAYGYWRIETVVEPQTTDFWALLLRLPNLPAQFLLLPTAKLKQMLDRAHNPEKFSLFAAKAGFAFAAQPLYAARRLAIVQNPDLLDSAENRDLRMDEYLNNWQQLTAQMLPTRKTKPKPMTC